jgi:hypothetical protein
LSITGSLSGALGGGLLFGLIWLAAALHFTRRSHLCADSLDFADRHVAGCRPD